MLEIAVNIADNYSWGYIDFSLPVNVNISLNAFARL